MVVNPNMIPRSSIVSGKFKYDAAVMKEQCIIERQMEEVRLKEEEQSHPPEENTEESESQTGENDLKETNAEQPSNQD